jgi:hypothetical protein
MARSKRDHASGKSSSFSFFESAMEPDDTPSQYTATGDPRRAYFEALGTFVNAFSRVETLVTLTLRRYAKTPTEIAKIIFAGAKIDLSSRYIKQLAEATGSSREARDDLGSVFQQLGIINGVRNNVLHYGATGIDEGNAIVSDALKAKGEPTVFPISPEALEKMTRDLNKISIHLQYRHLDVDSVERPDVVLERILRLPWLYRHPQPPKSPNPAAAHPSTRKHAPKPSRPPRA